MRVSYDGELIEEYYFRGHVQSGTWSTKCSLPKFPHVNERKYDVVDTMWNYEYKDEEEPEADIRIVIDKRKLHHCMRNKEQQNSHDQYSVTPFC